MLTGSRSTGRSSENTSMRSTSETMRSVSSLISRVSARSSSPTDGFQQLRRAADAGERVLDLVRQHGGKAGDRARRAAMRHLAVDLVGHRAFLEHDDDRAGQFGNRRDVEVDDPLVAEARRGNVDAVFVDRRVALADLVDERAGSGCRRARSVRQRRARQDGGAGAEEVLRIGIGIGDEALADRS